MNARGSLSSWSLLGRGAIVAELAVDRTSDLLDEVDVSKIINRRAYTYV